MAPAHIQIHTAVFWGGGGSNKATHSAERDHIEGVSSSVDLIKEIAVSAVGGVVNLQLIAWMPKDREMFNLQKQKLGKDKQPYFHLNFPYLK